MDMRGYQHYREESLNSMTQAELLLRLYDELMKRLTQAEIYLTQKDYTSFEQVRSVNEFYTQQENPTIEQGRSR